MDRKVSRILDLISEFLSRRKGLLPIMGILLVILNGVLQFSPGGGWLVETNLFLHIGIILAIIGFLLAWAL
jgi:uncharacterized membrane protein SirB2